MLRRIAIFLLIFAALPAAAIAAAGPWTEVRSDHFTVLTNSSEAEARRIAGRFERMRLVLSSFVSASHSGAESPIIIVAFKDKKSFEALEPQAMLAKGEMEHVAMLLRGRDNNYVILRLDGDQANPFGAVDYEYTQYMLNRASTTLPVWLQVGLDEFYRHTEFEDRFVLLGQPDRNVLYYLAHNPLLPLETLLTVDYQSPYIRDNLKAAIFKAESWGLAHYLIVGDQAKGTHRLQTYINRLSQHENPIAAASLSFGDLDQLQQSLTRYVRFEDLKVLKVAQTVAIDESRFKSRSVAPAEADVVCADILLRNGRSNDAKAVLDAVLAASPKDASAHEVMGRLKLKEGDFAGAEKWFGEAEQMDPGNFRAQFGYAVAALDAQDKDQDELIESSLRTAIKLNPSYAPSYDALAMFYAARHKKLDEAHMLNLQAIQLEPDILAFRLDAAEVLTQNQDFASALNVLDMASRLARTTEESDNVQTRIDKAKRLQAAAGQP
jgi:Flp pilus assembly protein TadD